MIDAEEDSDKLEVGKVVSQIRAQLTIHANDISTSKNKAPLSDNSFISTVQKEMKLDKLANKAEYTSLKKQWLDEAKEEWSTNYRPRNKKVDVETEISILHDVIVRKLPQNLVAKKH